MAEWSGPWEVPAAGADVVGDATRSGLGEGDWRRLMRSFGDGVIRDGNTDALRVIAPGTSRTVRVLPGDALVQGALYRGTAGSGSEYVADFALPSAAGTYRVALRYDPAANTVRLVQKGTAALTKNQDGIWEVPLATIVAGTGAITQGMVSDDRVDTFSDYTRQVISDRINAAQARADLAYSAPRARAQVISAGVTKATGTWASVGLGQVQYTSEAMRPSATPSRLYATRSGVYPAGGRAVFTNPSGVTPTGTRKAAIRKNAGGDINGGVGLTRGVTVTARTDGDTVVDVPEFDVDLAAGDYIELFVQHNQGADLGLAGGLDGTGLWLRWACP